MRIKTKFIIPPLKEGVIERQRLLDRLQASKDLRLIFITGHAGSGKTTLVAQWIKEYELLAGWYSLGSLDNDTDVFLRNLLTALIEADHSLAESLGIYINHEGMISWEKKLPYIADTLFDLQKDLYLMLDDFHLVTSRESYKLLSEFLELIPSRLHLVILSRALLPSPLLRFKVRSQIAQVSADDLKFNDDEAAAFFHRYASISLASDQIHDLNQQADGWVGGLQLFALTLQDKRITQPQVEMLKLGHSETADYLIEEVISHQPKDISEFILKTVFLDRFEANLCREVTGIKNSLEVLDYLQQNNLFLISLDHEGKWYRYHHLFSDALRFKLQITRPELPDTVQRKAAHWLGEHRYYEEAFQQAFATNDMEFAAGVMEYIIIPLFNLNDHPTVIRWLPKLPKKIRDANPFFQWIECLVWILSDQKLIECETLLQQIEQKSQNDPAIHRFENQGGMLFQDFIIYTKGLLLAKKNQNYAIAPRLEADLATISVENDLIIGLTKQNIAECYKADGHLLAAEAMSKKAIAHFALPDFIRYQIQCLDLSANIALQKGCLQDARAFLEDASLLLKEADLYNTSLKYLIFNNMAWIYYHTNELDKALEYAIQKQKFDEQSDSLANIFWNCVQMTDIYAASRNWLEVNRYLQKMRTHCKQLTHWYFLSFTEAFESIYMAVQGDNSCSRQWVKKRNFHPDEPYSLGFDLDSIATIEFLLYCDYQYTEVIRHIEILRPRFLKWQMMGIVMNLDLYQARALNMLGEHKKADQVFTQALHWGMKEGYLQRFINYFREDLKTLKRYLEKEPKGQNRLFLEKVKGRCQNPSQLTVSPQQIAIQNNITRRELEMLQFIQAGLSNADICKTANVSLHTVKRHIYNIFAKLDVKNRVQAIQRARELSLL